MRVLILADLAGGVRTFVRELVRELTRSGVEVHLGLIGRGEVRTGAASCEVRNLRLEWMADPWADVAATEEWIGELIERHQPDVLHMNTFAPVRPAEIPVLLTAHSCVLTWWRAVHGVSAPASWGRYRRLVSDALERADLVVAPTRAFLAELQAVYGHLPRARVIRNGRSIRRDPRLDAGERLVLSAGRLWDEAKNARLVAEAATGIHGRVVVIGPGEVAGVETAGVLDDRGVIDWLARAAVFVEPARYEPFGLAALEAALCGCALVLGDIPTLRELWEEAAAFVSPDDAEALSFRVNQLLADDQRRRRAAVAAYTTALRYRPQAMAAGYLRAYRSLERDRSSAANMSRSSRSPAEGVRA